MNRIIRDYCSPCGRYVNSNTWILHLASTDHLTKASCPDIRKICGVRDYLYVVTSVAFRGKSNVLSALELLVGISKKFTVITAKYDAKYCFYLIRLDPKTVAEGDDMEMVVGGFPILLRKIGDMSLIECNYLYTDYSHAELERDTLMMIKKAQSKLELSGPQCDINEIMKTHVASFISWNMHHQLDKLN